MRFPSTAWVGLPLPYLRVRRFPFQCLSKQGREELSTAAVEQGPSQGARSGSRRTTRLPFSSLSPLFEELSNPRLNLIQPLAQVGFKHIGLGLHHLALSLELVLV